MSIKAGYQMVSTVLPTYNSTLQQWSIRILIKYPSNQNSTLNPPSTGDYLVDQSGRIWKIQTTTAVSGGSNTFNVSVSPVDSNPSASIYPNVSTTYGCISTPTTKGIPILWDSTLVELVPFRAAASWSMEGSEFSGGGGTGGSGDVTSSALSSTGSTPGTNLIGFDGQTGGTFVVPSGNLTNTLNTIIEKIGELATGSTSAGTGYVTTGQLSSQVSTTAGSNYIGYPGYSTVSAGTLTTTLNTIIEKIATIKDLTATHITSLVNATSLNQSNTLVKRDSAGDFSANIITGTCTQARWADYAEKYTGTENLDYGTVVEGSDDNDEVQLCKTPLSFKVIGVVSENPGFVINQDSTGKPVALKGKVKVRIIGKIKKNDIIVSAGNGCARAAANVFEYQNKIGLSLETNLIDDEKLVMCIL